MRSIFLTLAALALATPYARAEVGDTVLGVSAPVMLVDGTAYWGANATVLHRIADRWDLGAETGFHYRSRSYGATSVSSWVIPVMPTALYHFKPVSSTFHPFAGLGFGIAWWRTGWTVGGAGYSDTSVKLEMLAHAGATFGKARRFFADLRLGLLDGYFVFTPSLGWFFSL